MNKAWVCEWSANYDDTEGQTYRKKYKSFEEAAKGVRSLITSKCWKSKNKIKKSIEKILGIDEYPKLRIALANFFYDYLTRKDFYSEDFSFPSTNAIDYWIPTERVHDDEDDEEDDYDYDDEKFEAEYYDPSDFEVFVGKDSLSLRIHDILELETNMVFFDNENKKYFFNFGLYRRGELTMLDIKLESADISVDKAAYPLLVLKTLQDSAAPLTADKIAFELANNYHFDAERKAIGRHLKNIKELDFDIHRCNKGYFIPKKEGLFSASELFTLKKLVESANDIAPDQKLSLLKKLGETDW